MKSINKPFAAVLAIAAAMIGIARAQNQLAQQSAPNPDGMMGYGFRSPGIMGPGMMSPGMAGMMGPNTMAGTSGTAMCTAMAGHIDGRLAYLKAELKITEAQEQPWNTYGAAARDNTKTMLARCSTMMSRHSGSTVSLPDRLDQNEQLMAAHLDAMRAMNKALKPLYAVLGDDQKKNCRSAFLGTHGDDVRARLKA